MPSIAIVTDSDASLPTELAARYGIEQVPITVHFGDEVLETGVDIDEAEMFERIDRDRVLPTTAAPSPGKFAQAYQAAFDGGADSVICVCVSGEVSATYGAAMAARDLVPGRDVTVLDSRTLSMGQGFMVLEAAEAAAAGAPKEEIMARALEVRDRTSLYAALSTLKYLAMSGRVGHLAAGMGNLLRVQPILTIRDGKLDLLERVRTRRKAWNRVIELTLQELDGRSIERLAIVHSNAAEEAGQFQQQLCAALACPDEIIMAELSAGLSVHSGAGLVGAAFVTGQ